MWSIMWSLLSERNVSCNATSGEDSHTCSISLQGNANDVIIFISGLPFPENVRAVEEECGRVNVSWEVRVQIVVH